MNKVNVGDRFGKLIALKKVGHKNLSWLCRCDCGKEKVIWVSNLINKHNLWMW